MHEILYELILPLTAELAALECPKKYPICLYLESKVSMLACSFEPRHEKTGFLHMRKQSRRSDREADQRLCFRYIDSTIYLLSKFEISSL